MESSRWSCWTGRATSNEAVERLQEYGGESGPNTGTTVLKMSITALGLAAMRRQGSIEILLSHEGIRKYRVFCPLYKVESYVSGHVLYSLTAVRVS